MAKLLVVEDDSKVASALKRGLQRSGFTVDVAADGDDGWWMATEAEYDLVLLDVMLPGRDGFSVCADLRAADNWTPVIILTAKDAESAETLGLSLGADDYLTKPFSFPVLIARVQSVLRRCERSDPTPVAAGALRLDASTHRVWSSGVEVRLTRREFDVLEFLLRRVGQTVTKETILHGVWEFDFDGSANIVQVYITRLRRKLDLPHGTDHIQTVHGIGYRLVGDLR